MLNTIKGYGFEIYENPNSHIQYLLFKGIIEYDVDNKALINYKQNPLVKNAFGFLKMVTYDEMKAKYGEFPCYIVDRDKNILNSDASFKSELAIRRKFGIKKNKAYASHSMMNPDEEAEKIVKNEASLSEINKEEALQVAPVLL